jgi:hypothetical protein
MRATFTVYFENPFWVGLLESESEEGFVVAREVFGAEPSNAELLDFMLKGFASMRRSVPSAAPGPEPAKALNPKRAAREASREMSRPPSTKAQAALAVARDASATESRSRGRAEREADEKAAFLLRAGKRKEKRRGH